MNIKHSSRLIWLLLICAVSTLIFLIRLHGPTDLESYGQPASIGHLLDLVTQGNYLVQHNLDNTMMSAPPLHTWLMAIFATTLGLNRLALSLPSFLSVLTMSLLVFEIGRRRFGEPTGGLAALALLLSPAMAKHIALVGADPVFALAVATAVLAASPAWPTDSNEHRRWFYFWLASALATLASGPLGILLAASALFCHFLGARSSLQQSATVRPHLVGLALCAGFLLAWLIPAGLKHGFAPAAATLMLKTGGEMSEAVKDLANLLIRYLPFSLFWLLALWRIVRRPAVDAGERRFERYLASWLAFALLIVSLTEHQATDPLLALWPACALLAGREMAVLAERMGKTRFAGMAVVIGCILIGATYNAVHLTNAGNYQASAFGKELRLAADSELAANALKASGIDAHRLNHFGTPETLQLHLGTFRPRIDRTQLEELLGSASGPIDVATGSSGITALGVKERFPATGIIFRWPDDQSQAPVVQIYRIAR